MNMLVSIIIPVYNEEDRIKITFPKIKDYLQGIKDANFEIIFVNDGSKDKTEKVIKKLISNSKTFKLVSYKTNRGKGYALKKGFEKAQGDWIFFMDADLSTPIKYIKTFLNKAKDKNTIYIGSRKTKGSNVKKHQPWFREKLGQGFTLISNILLVKDITDFTCGFKLFPNRAGKEIFSKVQIDRWGFDSEVLFIAKNKGYNIKEIPVEWINDEKTKVNLFKDVPQSLLDIFLIRKNHFFKKYR